MGLKYNPLHSQKNDPRDGETIRVLNHKKNHNNGKAKRC